MASWQTHAVCVYLRATRKKRYRTVEAGLHSMANGTPRGAPAGRAGDRIVVAPLGGGEVVTVRPADGVVAGTGALVYLHGGAFVNGIQPQHWSLIGTSPTARTARCTSRATRWRPRTTSRRAHLPRRPCTTGRPEGPLHVLGDSAGGTLR